MCCNQKKIILKIEGEYLILLACNKYIVNTLTSHQMSEYTVANQFV